MFLDADVGEISRLDNQKNKLTSLKDVCALEPLRKDINTHRRKINPLTPRASIYII